MKLVADAIGANQLNAVLSAWGLLIGSRQQLLQPVACTEAFRVEKGRGAAAACTSWTQINHGS